MAESLIDARYELETPDRVTGQVLRPHSMGDIILTMVAGTAAIIVDVVVDQLAAGGVILFWALLMMTITYGRVYAVIGQWFHSLWIRLVHRGYLWKSTDKRKWHDPNPLNVNGIGDHSRAFMHARGRDIDAVFVEGSGSDLVAYDLPRQFDATIALGNALRRTATGAPGYRLGGSFVFSRRPPDVHAASINYAENMMPDVVFPQREGEPADDWTDADIRSHNLNTVAMELLGVLRVNGGKVRMAAAMSIKRDVPIPTRGIEASKLKRLSVLQIAQTITDELEAAGVTDAHLLGVDELQTFLRESWDIAGINNYRDNALGGEEQGPTDHWWQDYIRAHRQAVEIDGSWHTVLQLRANPDGKRSLPFAFRSVFTKDVPWLTVAMVGEAVRSNAEYHFLDHIIPAISELRLQIGFIHQGPRAVKRQQNMERRQELVDESKFSMRYGVFVCVSATSREALEDQVSDFTRHLEVRGYSPKRVTGHARQLPAFLTAVTGIRLL